MARTYQAYVTLRYCYQRGDRTMIADCPIGQNEVFTDTGAKFCKQDGNGYIDAAVAATDDIYGWAEIAAGTWSTGGNGTNYCSVDTSFDSVYYIPANSAVTINMRGKHCDIVVDSNRQRADVTTSAPAKDVLVIEEVDVENQCVWVRLNENERHATGV